jgi:hypothetical protein
MYILRTFANVTIFLQFNNISKEIREREREKENLGAQSNVVNLPGWG